MLEVARREGVRLDDPDQFAAFARQLERHITKQVAARHGPEPDGLARFQHEAVAELQARISFLAASILRRSPQTALLITLFGEGDVPGSVAVDERVHVEVTLKNGKTMIVQPTAVVEAGARMRGVERVKPVGPSLGHVLWVGRWPSEQILFAWDLRGALLSDALLPKLLARLRGIGRNHRTGTPGAFARDEREDTLRRLRRDDQLQVMRQALCDEMVDKESRRIPLRGIIRAGAKAIWDAGGDGSPYGVLTKLSAILRSRAAEMGRQERQVALDEAVIMTAGSGALRRRADGTFVAFDEAAITPAADDLEIEKLIHDYTAGLPPKMRGATQHYLRWTLAPREPGHDFKAYCAENRLTPYATIQRAADRGLQRLREKK